MTTLGRSSLTRRRCGRHRRRTGPGPRTAPAGTSGPAAAGTGGERARSSHRARRDERSRWLALIVRCAGMLMIVLDMTVVNVALPSIQSDLGCTPVGSRLSDQRVPDRIRRAAAARRAPGRSGTSPAGQEEGDALPFHEHGRFDRP